MEIEIFEILVESLGTSESKSRRPHPSSAKTEEMQHTITHTNTYTHAHTHIYTHHTLHTHPHTQP